MASIIETIRVAEVQVPELRQSLKDLREEARANDGLIDADEQVGIDRVEKKIDQTHSLITSLKRAWENNKAAYEKLRPELDRGLTEAQKCEIDDYRADRDAIADALADVSKAADDEDYATALELGKAMQRLVDLFKKRLENERLDGLTTEELMNVDLTDANLEEVFSEEYMRGLMTVEIKGVGDPKLKDLMDEIEKGLSSTRRPTLMEELSGVVGAPPSAAELDADYKRYLVLCKQRDAIGAANNKDAIEDLDEERHPDFAVSRGQLLFGKALGDALGIHEVYASLLSPTGGLVGPGNDFAFGFDAMHLSPDNPVGLHGTVHDAAGYLKSYHNEGPGYNYRDDEIEGLITDAIEMLPEDVENCLLPLTGQISGILYWTAEAGDEYVENRYNEGMAAMEQALADARNNAAGQVSRIIGIIDEKKREMAAAATQVREEIEERAEQAEEFVRDLAERAGAEVMQAGEALEDGVERLRDSAVETFEEASAGLDAIGEGASNALDSIANFLWS